MHKTAKIAISGMQFQKKTLNINLTCSDSIWVFSFVFTNIFSTMDNLFPATSSYAGKKSVEQTIVVITLKAVMNAKGSQQSLWPYIKMIPTTPTT